MCYWVRIPPVFLDSPAVFIYGEIVCNRKEEVMISVFNKGRTGGLRLANPLLSLGTYFGLRANAERLRMAGLQWDNARKERERALREEREAGDDVFFWEIWMVLEFQRHYPSLTLG